MAYKLYFAYGSNINLEQMAQRCPEAKVVEPVTLENHQLLFRGNGTGRGVATIAPLEGSTVQGLLWKISPRDEQILDIYEGYPSLYEKQPVNIRTQNGSELTVMAYVMTHEKDRKPTEPSVGYLNGIWEGFQQNNIPTESLVRSIQHLWGETSIPEHKRKENKNHER